MKIRKADEDELCEVAVLMRASLDVHLPFLPKLHNRREDYWFVSNVLFAEEQLFVAEDCDGQEGLLGMMSIKDGWLNQLYISPYQVGHGIGAKLLDHAKALSGGHLRLWCFVENERACQFYLKHGFVEMDRTDGHGNEEKEPDILYEWQASHSVQAISA